MSLETSIAALAAAVGAEIKRLRSELPTPPSVQVFGTLAEAQAWEASGPGRVGLYMGTPTPSPGDTTGPTPGTLAVNSITDTSYNLVVTGASDASGLHAEPYSFSLDNGQTWSSWRSSSTFAVIERSPGTVDQCRHRVRDNSPALNISIGAPITVQLTGGAPTGPVTVRQSNYGEATTRTVTALPINSPPQAGNLLVAMIGFDKDLPTPVTGFVPAGWTLAGSINNPGDTGAVCIWRIADGTETAVPWSHTWSGSGSTYNHVTLVAELSAKVTQSTGWVSSAPEGTSSVTQGVTTVAGDKVAVAFLSTDTATGMALTYAQTWAAPFDLAVHRVGPEAPGGIAAAAIGFATVSGAGTITAQPSPLPSDGHVIGVGTWA